MFWKKKKNPNVFDMTTPAGNIEVARLAVEHGDPQHAVKHLAWALNDEPYNTEARIMLNQLIFNHPNLVDLEKWDEQPIPYPIVAVRAYIAARQSDSESAFSYMGQIYQAVPGVPFLQWVAEWASDSLLLGKVTPSTMYFFLMMLSGKLSSESSQPDAELLVKTLPLLAHYAKLQPPQQIHEAIAALSILHRKAGRWDEAVSLAQVAHTANPTYLSATVLGNAYREKDMIDEAVAAYRYGVSLKPEDIHIRLDIGDTLCKSGRLEEGLQAYQEVLDREPNHGWAYPSFLYFRSFLEPDADTWGEKFMTFAKANPDNERAAGLLQSRDPYIFFLPEPTEAIISLAKNIGEKMELPAEFVAGVSSLEAPSAHRAIQLMQIELYGKENARIDAGSVQRPDPRFPRGEVAFVLWRYKGNIPQAAFAPPAPEVARLVGELAANIYEANVWWRKAGELATKIGASRLNDLLGVMLHPPARLPQFPMWVWLQRVQYAATFIIARLDSGWEGSLRRRTLLSLARGPMDWTVEAAIVVLSYLTNVEKVGKPEIEALYLDLFQNLPRPGGVPYEYALICCSLYIQPQSPQLIAVTKKAMENFRE